MREIYRSLRVEQVEKVAALLREAAIEVRIENGRSYKGSRRRNFSYRDSLDSARAVLLYVVHNRDLPEARRLLREAGLLANAPGGSYLPVEFTSTQASEPGVRSWLTPRRIRTILLVLIVLSLAAVAYLAPESA